MEYWQTILERATATLPVFAAHFSTLKLGTVGLAEYSALTAALPGLALARDSRVQAVDNARQASDFSWQELRLIALKVPKIIEGMVDEDSGLLDDLGKVYAITPWSADKTMVRCGLLGPVWEAVNAWQVAQVPARPAIVRKGVTQVAFMSKIAAYFILAQAEKNADHQLDEARRTLRESARRLERLSIRFLAAALGMSDPGSVEEQELRKIPTTTSSQLPETLGIKTFTQGGTDGLQLLIQYEMYQVGPGETAKLEWMVLDTDAGFTHSVPYDASGNALGPFGVGQTVRIRSAVSNSHGTRTGGVRQLTLIQPPE
jgi:hypothetical protein